ncbi:Bug family tripartite tricarboxylate transporter substrate binding protein [Paeniroseomonas aquatica]|uniref:Tripartite tricarboxylate transporter substrate binding protein n=1 Tax=Paeniroseomonas aquatica TaxID=373043 RepID=A0ABT8A4X8_9PROT|nr:tripartite tricarboxylate transporter substrate binding protein [Paeniroseomonas aquatica]MDN3564741.1 tripartite tricarboxylate transporter substrate binding protein [Paeniroseomonas aquatica]
MDGANRDWGRRGLLGGAAALALPSAGRAQGKGPEGWPQGRSVSLVVPFTPGGGTDLVARILQEGFAESFGGNFVMEHKPGAATTLGTRLVARAKPDGFTLLVGSNSALSQAPYAFRNLGYDPLRDFTPISLLFSSAYLLAANPRWGSLQQVVEAAKRAPGTLSYGTWGVGSTAHLLMLDLCERTGTEMLHVPFGGPAPALTEILAGRVDMMFTTFAPARAHVLEQRLVALGTPHEQRLAAVPAVPTLIEQGLPGFLVSAWWCLAAPAGLPAPLAAALEQAVRTATARPLAARLSEEFGLLPLPLGPDPLRARIAHDLAMNEGLMRKAGITPE